MNNEVTDGIKQYFDKIALVDPNKVDELKKLAERWSKHNVKGIHECGEQLKEFLPYLKKYQEEYRAQIRARESARSYLDQRSERSLDYLNEPG